MMYQLSIVALLLVAIISVQARPKEESTTEAKRLEIELNDAIEFNGEVYIRQPKKQEKKDSLKNQKEVSIEGIPTSQQKDETVEDGNKNRPIINDKTQDIANDSKQGTNVIEGDIIPSPYIEQLRSGKANNKRNVLQADHYKWPNQKYYYQLDSSLTNRMKTEVRNAIKEITQKTCIDFIEKADAKGYVIFRKTPDSRCSSSIGKTDKQPQYINVASWCGSGGIVHEILHSLGFLHEQSRADRDDYITIKWENVKKGYEDQFKKYQHPLVTTYKEPYDYKSIMHYAKNAFSKNGKDTMVPKKWFTFFIGNKNHMSNMDIKLLNKHYKCRKCENTGWGCWARSWFSCNRATTSCLGSCGFYCKA